MSKFKVGDRVLVKAPANENDGPCWDWEEMGAFNNTVHVVTGRDDEGWITFDGTPFVFSDDWMTLADECGDISDDPATITRRDRFAMAALPAIITISSAGQHDPGPVGGDVTRAQRIVFDCYELADAMEAARNKEGGS